MKTGAVEHEFPPHEQPLMAGSPATPAHPQRRAAAYVLIGILLSITAGLSNGLLLANLPQIQGALGLTSQEGAWLITVYAVGNASMSMLVVKSRQQLGMQRTSRFFLLGFVFVAGLQLLSHSYGSELALRTVGGVIAAGFGPLGMFYVMQGLPAKLRISGIVIYIGLTQVALPLARWISPALLFNGEIQNLYVFEFGLALTCLGSVAVLRLPPGIIVEVFERLDFVTFGLLTAGLTLLCTVLAQGRIVWWTTEWLGYATAGAVLFTGSALLIEHYRASPLLNTRWLGTRDILRIVIAATTMRMLLSEQAFGATGLMAAVGMGADQLVAYHGVLTACTLAGVSASLVLLKNGDLNRPIVIAVAIIAVAAFADANASNLTRPANLFLTQGAIAFSAALFLGPTLLTGLVHAIAKGPAHLVTFSAIFSISQTIGGLLGTAFLGTYQILRQRVHFQDLVNSIVLSDPQVALRVQQLGGAYAKVVTDPVQRQALGVRLLGQQLTRESNVAAFNDVFFLVGVLATIALVLMGGSWLSNRVRGIDPLTEHMAVIQKLVEGKK